MIDALLFSRITFSFFEATAVHCASDAATMVAYVGCCVGSGTGNHFLEHWQTKITDAGEICGASREAQNIKHMRGCILLILLSLDAPGMSSKHRGRRPGARRSGDARRQSAGVRRFVFRQQQQCPPRRGRFMTCPIDRWSSCRPALYA